MKNIEESRGNNVPLRLVLGKVSRDMVTKSGLDENANDGRVTSASNRYGLLQAI